MENSNPMTPKFHTCQLHGLEGRYENLFAQQEYVQCHNGKGGRTLAIFREIKVTE